MIDIGAFPAAGGAIAAVDSIMNAGNSGDGKSIQGDNVTSVNDADAITLTADATLLVFTINWGKTSGVGDPSSRTFSWGAQTMTEVAYVRVDSTSSLAVSIYRLENPTAGAQGITGSWGEAWDIYLGAIAFKGGALTTADAVTDTEVEELAVPSDANGASVAVFCADSNEPAMNFNEIFVNAPFGPGGGASYQLGGTSNLHTFNPTGGLHQALAGIHIVAA